MKKPDRVDLMSAHPAAPSAPPAPLLPRHRQAFEVDPHEFIHKANDPSEDYLSPRVPAINCIIDLAKYRGKDILPRVRGGGGKAQPNPTTKLAACLFVPCLLPSISLVLYSHRVVVTFSLVFGFSLDRFIVFIRPFHRIHPDRFIASPGRFIALMVLSCLVFRSLPLQLLSYTQNVLTTYAATPEAQRDHRAKDSALVALGYDSLKLKSKLNFTFCLAFVLCLLLSVGVRHCVAFRCGRRMDRRVRHTGDVFSV